MFISEGSEILHLWQRNPNTVECEPIYLTIWEMKEAAEDKFFDNYKFSGEEESFYERASFVLRP